MERVENSNSALENLRIIRKSLYKSRSRNKNRPPTKSEQIAGAVINVFTLRNASFLTFETIYEDIKRYCQSAWQYIKDDRKKLLKILQYYDENFEFVDGFLSQIQWWPGKPMVAKYSVPAFEKKCEAMELKMEERRKLIRETYDVVLEHEALKAILAVFYKTERDVLQFGFIEMALQRKFLSSEDFVDLMNYVGEGVAAKVFLSSRSYLFVDEVGDCFAVRSKHYSELVYAFNEFLRGEKTDDDDEGDAKTNWKSLTSLMEYYFNEISPQIRADINLTTRESFLSFLHVNNFVFDVRLEDDFEIASIVPLAVVEREIFSQLCDDLLCNDFDALLDAYNAKLDKFNKLPPFDEGDEYFDYSFDPANAVDDDDEDDSENLENFRLTPVAVQSKFQEVCDV